MNKEINELIDYALKHQMIEESDVYYSANLLLDLFKIDSFQRQKCEEKSIHEILQSMLHYAVDKGMISDSITEKNLFDTRIMNCIMPRPSEVVHKFKELYQHSPQDATNYYYQLSINSNYIRKARIDKNIKFEHYYKYGIIQITINLSKPEKDPKAIAAAKNMKTSHYPQCLLCKENVGYAGNIKSPARQNHRIIPLNLSGDRYYLQYSPYVYYNEHCIVLNENHQPMKIDHRTFEHLFAFVEQFPHYMLGSNADLPIVGGSILTHDHYQGGCHHFPMEDAKVIRSYQHNEVNIDMLYWPLSTLRLTSSSKEKIIEMADMILNKWINYSDESLDIVAYTNGTRHNTITPIARMKDGYYQLDLVLRNNRTTEKYPLGIFHPHAQHHHIKKENIGLIEVMGLAVLPARLKNELEDIKKCLLNKEDFSSNKSLQKHAQWFQYLKTCSYTNIDEFLEIEVTKKFVAVLEDAGVYKMNDKGIKGFTRFVENLFN